MLKIQDKEMLEALEKISKTIKIPRFNPYVYINRNKNKNPAAILCVLESLKTRADTGIPFKVSPWAYAAKAMAVQDGNYNERDYCKRVEAKHGPKRTFKCPQCGAMREFLMEIKGQRMCHNCLTKNID